MVWVHGSCTPAFEPLKRVFEGLLSSGEDLGASLAVTVEGEPVVDLWGGWADAARTRPWERDTLVNVWSTTKTMVALTALLLIERGELDPDATVAHYWPAFAANGKQDLRVRHLLSHSSGLPTWAEPVTLADVVDWERSTALLAAQAPWWTPGNGCGYQALNHGHLVGELVRRITGRMPGAFFADAIAAPLAADFHIGLADSEWGRVADIQPPPPQPMDMRQLPADSPMVRTLTNPLLDPGVCMTPAWRSADIGAANGHGHARSVARLQSVIACGGEVGGLRLLSPRTIAQVFEPQAEGVDRVLGVPLVLGLGYGLPQPQTVPFLPPGRIAFWGGWGGSLVVADADRRMSFAYMMNKMAPGLVGGPNAATLAACIYGILARVT